MSPTAQQQQPFPRPPEPAIARQMFVAYEDFRIFWVLAHASQQGRVHEEIPLLTSSASAPKQTTLPVDLLVHHDAASC
jgi:hypothetical protein